MVFVSLLVFLVKNVEARSQFSLENSLPYFYLELNMIKKIIQTAFVTQFINQVT
jgi:hypothetical protein